MQLGNMKSFSFQIALMSHTCFFIAQLGGVGRGKRDGRGRGRGGGGGGGGRWNGRGGGGGGRDGMGGGEMEWEKKRRAVWRAGELLRCLGLFLVQFLSIPDCLVFRDFSWSPTDNKMTC